MELSTRFILLRSRYHDQFARELPISAGTLTLHAPLSFHDAAVENAGPVGFCAHGMNTSLSPNTQAILLLTAPLLTGGKGEPVKSLTLLEYNQLARLLHERKKTPADLLDANAGGVLDLCAARVGKKRLEMLLGRGFLLSQVVDRWQGRGIWVTSRAEPEYPKRLKKRLKEAAPPVLYGCGDRTLLDGGGLAVVGSRHVDDALCEYTRKTGALAAAAGMSVVSGAARGIDRSAMNGALESGGTVIGVMADSLERAALARENRGSIRDGRLVLISPYDPNAGFHTGNAMQRNKVIYALADAALVVTSDFNTGGTWNGAIEQLEKLHLVPVFVRKGADTGKGNAALIHRGGLPWPEPETVAKLEAAIANASQQTATAPRQEVLRFQEAAVPAYEVPVRKGPESPKLVAPPFVCSGEVEVESMLCDLLTTPASEAVVAELLQVTSHKARARLGAMTKRGLLEKVSGSKPVLYRTVPPAPGRPVAGPTNRE